MSADDIAEFYVETATVEPFLGANNLGIDTFGPAQVIQCFADDSRRMVRNADGEQVISETTLYTYPSNAVYLVPNARVTIGSAVSRVIKSNLNTSGALDLPDHVAAVLT
jgi:hypothetical protein